MAANVAAAPLEYAPGAPVRRRKRIRRVILLLLLLGIGSAVWKWGPAAREHATLLYWQRQCLNFEFPPDVVLYVKDPARAAVLLRQPDPQFVPLPLFYGRNQPMVTHAVYQPRALREFATRSSAGSAPGDRSIVFCHERRTPAGKRRLVIVYTNPWSDFGPMWQWELYDPAGVMSLPKLLSAGAEPVRALSGFGGFYIPRRLGPRQADAADPTRFSLPLLSNGQPIGGYDGRLTDEDQVVITKREGR